jgi:MinD-like ATPase involved in chromosome partitioning or flagellar assembly
MKGTVITFYSYKGGVGRSMALANISALLAKWGHSVLILDWDFEAPGLEFYFDKYTNIQFVNNKNGIIDILVNHKTTEEIDWKQCITQINLPSKFNNSSTGKIDIITSGLKDESYYNRVQSFDYTAFYKEKAGGKFIEFLRDSWKDSYDFILVDSRTGVSDNGGICTVQLPDILVMLFTATEQGLAGTLKIGLNVEKALAKLPVERYGVLTLPIPSRFDMRSENKIAHEWLDKFSEQLLPLAKDWLPEEANSTTDLRFLFSQIFIPHVAVHSFGESLPVIEEGTNVKESIGYAYETISAILSNKLNEIELISNNREKLISKGIKKNIGTDVISKSYDVFISRKSQDGHMAKELYDFLTSKGLKVFESDQSLRELGNLDYIKAIDEALVNSTHMVVVGSSAANIQSSWVEAEWLFFLNRKRSGKTSGNLLTVATSTLKLEEVPPSLGNYEVIPYNEKNFSIIYNYVRQPNTPAKQAPKNPFPAERENKVLRWVIGALVLLLVAVFAFYYVQPYDATLILQPSANLQINRAYPAFNGGKLAVVVNNEVKESQVLANGEVIFKQLPYTTKGVKVAIRLENPHWKTQQDSIELDKSVRLAIIPNGSLGVFRGQVRQEGSAIAIPNVSPHYRCPRGIQCGIASQDAKRAVPFTVF